MRAKQPKLKEWDGCLAIFREQVPTGQDFDPDDWPAEYAARIIQRPHHWLVEVLDQGCAGPLVRMKLPVGPRREVVMVVKRLLQMYLQGYYDRGGD
jgi:hypothetical protein